MPPFLSVPVGATPETYRGTPVLDLRDYLRILRRNWILIVAATLAGLLVGGVFSVLAKPTYKADTELFVATTSSGSVQELQQGNIFTQARVQSYVKTVRSPLVLQPVIDSLGLETTPAQLSNVVTASSDLNTVLINITVEDGSPVRAAATAEAVATSLISAVDSLERPKTGGTSPVSLSIIKPAVAPNAPFSPNTRLNLLLGLVVGLALGIGLTLLRTLTDTRIRGEADMRNITDAPLLGGMSFDAETTKKPLLTQIAPQSPRAESFRQLRTNLRFANVSGHAKTVLITSSLPGEGKSTIAINLAIALAQSGESVCLIDADLRRPMVADYMGIDTSLGLTTALVGLADVDDLLQSWGDDNLFILASGQVPPNPSELLGSTDMKQLLMKLEQAFDTVIIDAPPLLPVTDAAVLSQHVGGVVLVVGTQKLKHQDLVKSIAALQLVGSNLLGVVLNRLPPKGSDAYTYSYGGHDATLPNDEAPFVAPGTSRRQVWGNQKSGWKVQAAASADSEVIQHDAPRPATKYPPRRLSK